MKTTEAVILPGATLGLLGSGQLGRMFIEAAHKKGYLVHVLAPDRHSPAGQLADQFFCSDYTDLEAVAAFARSVEVVTFEFENIPIEATEVAARYAPVRPDGRVLHITQNRLREKITLQEAGLTVTPFEAARSREELDQALECLGTPAILKTAAWGYDGKGQRRVDTPDEADAAWEDLASDELIVEQAIAFDREISVVAARSARGEVLCFDPFENKHHHHVLDITLCPARIPDGVRQKALQIAHDVMARLDVVGVLCVEFFLTADGNLLINELAPRPHNSGHLTIDACVTSQFEQQLRAICGLPLGSVRLHQPAAMANLLGDLWGDETLRWDHALESPEIKLRLYGKNTPHAGRKMGHLTAFGDTVQQAEDRVRRARSALQNHPSLGVHAGDSIVAEDMERTTC